MPPGSAADLKPRRKVHLVADDRVVHPIVAAEIADGGKAGADADADPERPFEPALAPFLLELAHAALHRDRHHHAGLGILLHAPGFGVAEEQQHRVADVLVDGGAVRERDLRHLGQVLIEDIRQLLGFQLVGGFGEACDVGEEDGQLLALGGYLDRLRAAEDRPVNLRRQILRQLRGKRLEHPVLLRDALVCLLQPLLGLDERLLGHLLLGDVRHHRDRSARNTLRRRMR